MNIHQAAPDIGAAFLEFPRPSALRVKSRKYRFLGICAKCG